MPIISAEPIQKNIYRVTINVGYNQMENIVVSQDGLYNVYYIKDAKCINKTGKILNIVQNRACPKNSYILFDWSEDSFNHRERINFYKIQNIIDITPNDAYNIALKHGFVGTVDDWLESLKGNPGSSAYELAVEAGFEGTTEEWLESLKGPPGPEGPRGQDGKSAYEIAVDHGFEGTEEEWLSSLGDAGVMNTRMTKVEKTLEWVNSMDKPE